MQPEQKDYTLYYAHPDEQLVSPASVYPRAIRSV